jgi:hypothetical protein
MNCYVVYIGRRLGVYDSWPHCQVTGFPNNSYKGFETWEKADHKFSKFKPAEEHNQMVLQQANQIVLQQANQGERTRLKFMIIMLLVLIVQGPIFLDCWCSMIICNKVGRGIWRFLGSPVPTALRLDCLLPLMSLRHGGDWRRGGLLVSRIMAVVLGFLLSLR